MQDIGKLVTCVGLRGSSERLQFLRARWVYISGWVVVVGRRPPVVCSVVRTPAGILTQTTALLLHQLITGVLLLGRIEICPSILTNTLEYNPMQKAGCILVSQMIVLEEGT